MGMGPAVIKVNLELWKNGIFKETNSVIEMGAEGLHLSSVDFEGLVRMYGIPDYKKENSFASRSFYELLGIKNYSCIDWDLNYPLEDKSLYGKYDLVTDYGTNEHIFNTSEAYRTMHRLCKTGGILAISQAVYRGNGYYAYDPSFFEGMAAANNYRILFSSFIINDFHVPLSWELIDAFDWTKLGEIRVFYAMQKLSELDFHDPYQDMYLSMNQKHHGYQLKYLQNPSSRSYTALHTLSSIDDKSLFREFRRRLYRKIERYLPKMG